MPLSQPPRRRDLKVVEAVRREMTPLASATSAGLKDRTEELKRELQSAKHRLRSRSYTKAFALMAEAMRRVSGRTFYDVQLLGGLILSQGRIAEMQTGEGKTITTALPAFFFALLGQGVHVATTNFYLAERDCEDVQPAFEQLGLTVGLLPDEHDADAKRIAYQCDVTYGTGYEFGFDFLRDQIAVRNQRPSRIGLDHIRRLKGQTTDGPQLLQRPHAFAIIDEADSVLIDEATMPLILSSARPGDSAERLLQFARKIAMQLTLEQHYEVNTANRSIQFTDEGWQVAHEPLYRQAITGLSRPWSQYVEQALRAELLLERNIDYVVQDGKVAIVDQNTGRIHDERTWRNGLHQSVELKEGVELSPEKDSDGRISRQRYFRFYESVCGMTGTATGNEAEFRAFYQLPVVSIPTHRPCLRRTFPVRAFGNDESRDAAILKSAVEKRSLGQPVLIGTRTIAHSLRLEELFQQHGIEQTVLNGVQDAEEAEIIGRAGGAGTVTIATNMAGRGTDIKLCSQAKAAGGLHVIGAEPNLSPRVDRQLAGRAARQGQAGSAQFFVAADDEVFSVTESELPNRLRDTADESGESHIRIDDKLASLQSDIERSAFERRKRMFEQDHWMESVMEVLAKRGSA